MKSFPDMKKAGANSVRIVSVTNDAVNSWSWQSSFTKQKACVKASVDNKLIPILEFHDVTCGNGYDDDKDGKNLKKCVDYWCCLLYTSDAADERSSVDLGGRRIIKKNKYNRARSVRKNQ